MKFSETIIINAPVEKIFQLYESVEHWKDWDAEVESSSITGEFKTGAIGKLKPKKGPQASIEITEVTKPHSFTASSKLPLCLMQFEHQLTSDGDTTKVTHSVTFSGALSFLFGRLIGSGIKKGLPISLSGLKKAAES